MLCVCDWVVVCDVLYVVLVVCVWVVCCYGKLSFCVIDMLLVWFFVVFGMWVCCWLVMVFILGLGQVCVVVMFVCVVCICVCEVVSVGWLVWVNFSNCGKVQCGCGSVLLVWVVVVWVLCGEGIGGVVLVRMVIVVSIVKRIVCCDVCVLVVGCGVVVF